MTTVGTVLMEQGLDPRATPESVPHIGRCLIKGCRETHRVEVPRRYQIKYDRWGTKYLTPSYLENWFWKATRDGIFRQCPTHGRTLKYTAVQGRRVEDIRCDARCTGARGHKCDCSCGGSNHGSAWR